MTTTLEHTETAAEPQGGGLARHQNFGHRASSAASSSRTSSGSSRALTLDSTGRPFGDQVATFTGVGWIIGFWIGIGAFNGPFRWLLGRDHTREDDLYYAGTEHGQGALLEVHDRPQSRRRPVHRA